MHLKIWEGERRYNREDEKDKEGKTISLLDTWWRRKVRRCRKNLLKNLYFRRL